MSAGTRSRFRPEVQALRAVAVMVVVLFHLWPNQMPGGYVGVDVFFVISGFLITSHLAEELFETNRIRLARFYARRIRRLLPAAFLVLAATLVAVLLLTPSVLWSTWLRDIIASAVYAVNWVLAAASVDYFAAEDIASPVQHFWSLALEEQFYLIWPLLLTVAWLARRKWVVLMVLSVVFVGCLAYSVWGAYEVPSFAYFATPAHGWEFAAGGFVALLLPKSGLKRGWWLGITSWIGWAAIIGSAFLFDASTPFPGWVALLPVMGTVLVVVAGMPEARWSPAGVIRFAPTQFLGDISYSIYLWHWPLIVLAPFVIAADRLTVIQKLSILALAILLAWATKVLVEDRARVTAHLRTGWRTFTAAGVATAILVGASLGPVIALQRAETAAASHVLEAFTDDQDGVGDPCFGALASLDAERCPQSHVVTDPSPPVHAFVWVKSLRDVDPYFDETRRVLPDTVVELRSYAPVDTDPRIRVALVGDSHGLQLLPAILFLGKQNDWAVDLYSKTSCRPLVQVFESNVAAEYKDDCPKWKEQVADIVAAGEYDLVVTSAYTMGYHRQATAAPDAALIIEGFSLMWDRWLDSGASVLVVSDGPSYAESVPQCVESSRLIDDPCSAERGDVTAPDPLMAAANAFGTPKLDAVDILPAVCDELLCHPVVGGMITYRDKSHLSAGFALTLAPLFAPTIQRLVPGAID